MVEHQTDPRLAHTGKHVIDREIIDEGVLLSDFERILEVGEALERGEDPFGEETIAALLEPWDMLAKFIDCHGRQLLEMAKKGRE